MNEHLDKIIKNPKFVPISIGVVAFGIGTGVGYILGRRNKNIAYEVQVHDMPEQLNFDYEGVEEFLRQHETPDMKSEGEMINVYEDGKKVGEEFVSRMPKKIPLPLNEPEIQDDPEPVRRSIFAPNSDEWDYEKELASRSPLEPYVIHRDEFYADELGYTQSTLTYYAGDNILVDEDDSPIYNHDMIIGPLLFGHGSGDQNVFHVRNDKRKAEYEILHDPGLYSVEVLGLAIEDNQRVKEAKDVKHSGAVRKFRLE